MSTSKSSDNLPSYVPSDFPLPAVASSLAPYIRNPAEITLIRRQLSATLDNLIQSSKSSTQSLTTQRAIRSLTGTHKSYYEASLENQKLQKEWESLTSDIQFSLSTNHSEISSIKKSQQQQDDLSKTYDQVLELRRIFSQLTILNKYTDKLKSVSGNGVPIPSIIANTSQSLPPPPSLQPLANSNSGADVLLPLEKAVVKAATELKTEEKLLEELKKKHGTIDPSQVPPEVHSKAIQTIKTELEQWLDTQLRLAGEGTNTPRKQYPIPIQSENEKFEDGDFDLDATLERIQAKYDEYVKSREEMLYLFTLANQPLKKDFIPPKSSAGSQGNPGDPEWEVPKLLPVLDSLLENQRQMKEITVLSSAMKESTSVASRELDNTLGRLRSESQLLERYGGGVPTSQRNAFSDESVFQDSIDLLQTWGKAAEESLKTTNHEVEKDASKTEENLEQVQQLIDALKELLPQEKSHKSRKDRSATWKGIRGNIGFDDDI